MVTKFYQHILSMIFAVKEINKNPKILPNLTLGLNIYDTYNRVQMTYHSTLNLLFKSHHFSLNYECDTNKKLIAVIGALASETSFDMAKILSIYKIPQITYGSFARAESEMIQLSSFYCMVSSETHQYRGIVSLLKHFGWTWVGLFVVDDDSGEHFLKALEPLFSESGICSDFTQRIQNQGHFRYFNKVNQIMHNINQYINDRKSRIFVIYGDIFSIISLWFFMDLESAENKTETLVGKVWVITGHTDFALTSLDRDKDLQLFQGAISFMVHSNEFPGFQDFLQTIKPKWTQADDFLKRFWEEAFDCSVSDSRVTFKISGTCSGEERLESLTGPFFEMHMTGHSYSIYNAIYTVAHALHAFYSSRSNPRAIVGGKKGKLQNLHPWQVGQVDPNGPEEKEFEINDSMITWHRNFNQVSFYSLYTNDKMKISNLCHPKIVFLFMDRSCHFLSAVTPVSLVTRRERRKGRNFAAMIVIYVQKERFPIKQMWKTVSNARMASFQAKDKTDATLKP
ncbi:hypothetical protein JD844_001062 [Phrynosoma platyrhinos]|uniref:Receptor ligand binding region domain-containing protein n=1 Tax=Phrynosoma platyrhinos TaxID=52577 RepID=A0ABQ7T987_PHRPL|nr:hypothetical protein JD844_001062 [Phrynosoma platyrhinos]